MNGLITLFFVCAGAVVLVPIIALVLEGLGPRYEVRIELSIRDVWVGVKVVTIQRITYVMVAVIPCVVLIANRRWRSPDPSPPTSRRPVRGGFQ